MIDLIVLNEVAHVGSINSIVFLLLNSLRHIVLVDELTQSGKYTPHSHSSEHSLGGGVPVNFLNQFILADGGEVL
jgi:hypothetical protein